MKVTFDMNTEGKNAPALQGAGDVSSKQRAQRQDKEKEGRKPEQAAGPTRGLGLGRKSTRRSSVGPSHKAPRVLRRGLAWTMSHFKKIADRDG